MSRLADYDKWAYVTDSDDDEAATPPPLPPPPPPEPTPPPSEPAPPSEDWVLEAYKRVARAGAQLAECARADAYAACAAVVAGFEAGTLRLDRPLVGVVDGALDAATCARYAAAVRDRFDARRADQRMALQVHIRGDDVEFLPLAEEPDFLPEAKAALAGVAAAVAAASAPRRAIGGVPTPPEDATIAVLVVDETRAGGKAKRAALNARWRRRPCGDLAKVVGVTTACHFYEATRGHRVDPRAPVGAVVGAGPRPAGELLNHERPELLKHERPELLNHERPSPTHFVGDGGALFLRDPAADPLAAGDAAALPARLLVPASAQLSLYDGVRRERPRYVPHRDNDPVRMGDGENHRELTAILYLDAAPAPGAGGELRCYLGTAPTDTTGATATETVDVAPAPGRLVLFRARDLVHEVRPVVGWRRAALSVWVLRDARDGSGEVR